MTHFVLTKNWERPVRSNYTLELRDEKDDLLTSCGLQKIKTAFGDTFVDTLCFGGVATPIQHRRKGYVRELFSYAWQWGIENGAAVSLLHPFSFSYYQKFGYGKVADHKIVRCPISAIDFVPRESNLVKFDGSEEQWEQLYRLHNTFCQGRLLMMLRCDEEYFAGKEIYLFYEGDIPTGYIAFTVSQRLAINHYEDRHMSVHEIVYTTPQALKAVLGFIRMLEGEMDTVEFANLAMCPEVEMQLRHYMHTDYRLLPDLMARVLHTEKMLQAHRYPQQEGAFRIRVEDSLPTVAGSFLVEFGGGQCAIKKLPEGAAVDMTVDAPAFARLLYGYDAVTPQQAAYADGISIDGCADDFFRAFGNRPAGMFEHF